MTELSPATESVAAVSPATAAEAARYAVLRRLGPALKHDMLVNLQAVTMMSELLGARLERGMPTQAELQNSLARIHRTAREAVANCLKVVGWIEPPEDEVIGLREGVEASLALVRSSFNFRGMVVLTLQWQPRPQGEAMPFEPSYRLLDWANVQALADVESLHLRREKGCIVLRLPRMVTTTPLQIAPL
jgi:hypothetical protein